MPTVPPDPHPYLSLRSTGMGYRLNRNEIPDRRWLKAARLLVEESNLSINAIALQVGVDPRTLRNWRHTAKFQKIVEAYTERLQAVVFSSGVARKVHRVRLLNEAVEEIQEVKRTRVEWFREWHAEACLEWNRKMEAGETDEERAAIGPEPKMPPGALTGWLTSERKGAGTGNLAEVNDVLTFDASLYKAFLLTLEQAEAEMHALENPEEAKGGLADARPGVTIVFPVATPEQLEATENAQVIDMPPQMRRLMQRRDGMPLENRS